MSEETYVMCGKDEGEEHLVQRSICVKCGAFEFVSLEKAKTLSDENFQCSICYTPPGVVKAVQTFVTCGQCGTTMGPDRTCYCIPENKPLLRWLDTDATAKRLEEQIEESKMQGLQQKIIRNAKQEELDRKVRMDLNLDKNNVILQMIHNIPDEQIEEFKKTQEELKKTKKELEDVSKED